MPPYRLHIFTCTNRRPDGAPQWVFRTQITMVLPEAKKP